MRRVHSPGWEDPWRRNATLSSILAWRVPWILSGCKESDTTEWFSLITRKGTALLRLGHSHTCLPSLRLPDEIPRRQPQLLSRRLPFLGHFCRVDHLLTRCPPTSQPLPYGVLPLTPPGWLQADRWLLTRQVPGAPGRGWACHGPGAKEGASARPSQLDQPSCPHWVLPGGNAERLRRLGTSFVSSGRSGLGRLIVLFILSRIPKGTSRITKFSYRNPPCPGGLLNCKPQQITQGKNSNVSDHLGFIPKACFWSSYFSLEIAKTPA